MSPPSRLAVRWHPRERQRLTLLPVFSSYCSPWTSHGKERRPIASAVGATACFGPPPHEATYHGGLPKPCKWTSASCRTSVPGMGRRKQSSWPGKGRRLELSSSSLSSCPTGAYHLCLPVLGGLSWCEAEADIIWVSVHQNLEDLLANQSVMRGYCAQPVQEPARKRWREQGSGKRGDGCWPNMSRPCIQRRLCLGRLASITHSCNENVGYGSLAAAVLIAIGILDRQKLSVMDTKCHCRL